MKIENLKEKINGTRKQAFKQAEAMRDKLILQFSNKVKEVNYQLMN